LKVKKVGVLKLGRRAKQITEFDAETGEVYKDFVTFGTQNGDGWMIMYKEPFLQLAIEAPPVAWKVFVILSSKQPFEGGIKTTKQAIANQLKISYPLCRCCKRLDDVQFFIPLSEILSACHSPVCLSCHFVALRVCAISCGHCQNIFARLIEKSCLQKTA